MKCERENMFSDSMIFNCWIDVLKNNDFDQPHQPCYFKSKNKNETDREMYVIDQFTSQ